MENNQPRVQTGEGDDHDQGKDHKRVKVMVAIDESEVSLYALSWALDYLFAAGAEAAAPESSTAEAVDEALLVHVQQPFQNFVFPAGPVVLATSTVLESVRKAQQQNSELLLSKAYHVCLDKHKPVKVETVIMEGDPKEMICQAAERMNPDVLVVGSRGLGKIRRALLGSVSDYCAHHARCPTVIVKPPHK